MRKLIFLFILTYFPGGCAREVSTYSFENTDSVKVDESQTVLTRFPSGLKEISDSVVGMVNAGQKISLYNVYTGKNLLNFSTQLFNFDSLFKSTFQKHYEGKREYTYDAHSAGGLSHGNSQVLAFSYSDNTFYIYVNTLVEVKHLNDSDQLKKYAEQPEVKAVLKKTGSIKLSVSEYIEFIFVTDDQFKIKKVIPLYERNKLTQEKYSCFFQKGFTAGEASLYVPILKAGETFGTLRSLLKQDDRFFSLAKLNISDYEAVDYRLSYKEIDLKDFSLGDYLSSTYFTFKNDAKGLLFCSGKEICAVETGEKVFSKAPLKKNEWISNFYNSENDLTLVTYTIDKKTHPSDIDIAYCIDSISSRHIKVFDKKNNKWLFDKALSIKANPMFLVTNNKIIYLEKDKQNYYFKFIRYNEN